MDGQREGICLIVLCCCAASGQYPYVDKVCGCDIIGTGMAVCVEWYLGDENRLYVLKCSRRIHVVCGHNGNNVKNASRCFSQRPTFGKARRDDRLALISHLSKKKRARMQAISFVITGVNTR